MEFRQKKKTLGSMLFVLALMMVLVGCTEQASVDEADLEEVQETVMEESGNDNEVVEEPEEEILAEDIEVKTFVLNGGNFYFEMDGRKAPELRVKKGDKVRIEFTALEGFHDWVVDEFGAVTGRVKEGESTFVEFTADQEGSFEYYCSVGSHRANGMVGTLVVE